MLVPSNRLFYALEAVMTIAYDGATHPVASRDLATRQQLSARYLEPILQKLVRAGFITSVRGAQGGYVLKPDQQHRTLADILAALAEDENLPPAATPMGEALLTPLALQLQQQMGAHLATITLADMCVQARAKQLPIANPISTDFAI